MICIYHSRDWDGYTSGAIVKKKYPDAVLIGYDYGQELPTDKIPAGEPIIMVDVSMTMEQMFYLALNSGFKMTWIDHHGSAIKEFDEFCKKHHSGIPFLNAILKVGIAACELTWQHLFPDEEMPKAVELLGKFDTWRKDDCQWDTATLPFQYGMRQICNSPETFPAHLLGTFYVNTGLIYDIMKNGAAILEYLQKTSEVACRRGAFECIIDGLRAICLCSIGGGSNEFTSVYDEAKHDIMVPFFFDGTQWIFSMYTTKPEIDCSIIANARGGGGHKAAAGFETTNILNIFPKMYLFQPQNPQPMTVKWNHQIPVSQPLEEGETKGNQKPVSDSGVQAAPPSKS